MNICSKCFDNEDLQAWVRSQGGPRGCDYCGRKDAPTAAFDDLTDYMRSCLKQVWGYAVEQLPYMASEGGYQGRTWDTWDLLFEELGLELPRDKGGKLASGLASEVSQEIWCDFDWLSLDEDEVLWTSWASFCEIVKHHRRFFFGDVKQDPHDRDHFVPSALLQRIASLILDLDLIKQFQAGTRIYRARAASSKALLTPAELGPPPPDHALQSNRMNPPGVPMLYAAESPGVAIAEIRAKSAYVGVFELLRDVTVLDLVDLPNVPGVFAGDERWRRLALSFLHDFRDDIMKPVARDERTHIDYIPTQIVTEFFRHHGAGNVAFDGIRYPSAVVANGGNLVLFAVQEDVVDAVAQSTGHGAVGSQRSPKPWLRLVSARRRNRK